MGQERHKEVKLRSNRMVLSVYQDKYFFLECRGIKSENGHCCFPKRAKSEVSATLLLLKQWPSSFWKTTMSIFTFDALTFEEKSTNPNKLMIPWDWSKVFTSWYNSCLIFDKIWLRPLRKALHSSSFSLFKKKICWVW